MPSSDLARPLEILPSRSSGEDSSNQPNASQKRKRSENDPEKGHTTTRRKTACQSCRNRKVKCDNLRPSCGFCQSSGVECVYIENVEDKLVLDPATKLMVSRLDQILKGVEGINSQFSLMQQQAPAPSIGSEPPRQVISLSKSQNSAINEPSKDYLHIPACRGNADSVLMWPIFNHEFPPDSLIGIYFKPSDKYSEHEFNGNIGTSNPYFNSAEISTDTWTVPSGFQSLPDERIPTLIDRFLQNVHTKNPLLDVDALVRWGRSASEHGLGWDAQSCLILLACALGSISYPFFESTAVDSNGDSVLSPGGRRILETTSSSLYARELRQAESCFILACRRIGLLKYTVLGCQCHFYAGVSNLAVAPVYLMYTLRPLPSWNHFWQASTFFQLYLKTVTGSAFDESSSLDVFRLNGMDRTQRRLEQSLYWSCFKSEVEFRVELPMPQSAIADFEYPTMFPSPPSPPPFNAASQATLSFPPWQYTSPQGFEVRNPRTSDSILSLPDEGWDIRRHNRELCNEEQSWYYYLTEVALRRISNRIKNTFYQQDPESWTDIGRLIPIAVEFEAQIATWSASLPPVMQHYEKPLSPDTAVIGTPTENQSSASKELSWATGNRLLEMRSWLYQPFLYHAIHRSSHSVGNSQLAPDQQSALQILIASGIECNIKILEDRSLHHRHHGLWYDLRALVTATLILIAASKSGNVTIPGGLFGDSDGMDGVAAGQSANHRDRFAKSFEAMKFWEDEAPDIKRSRKLLERLVDEMRSAGRSAVHESSFRP